MKIYLCTLQFSREFLGGRGRGKHPAGLKGKEIGLFYARRNKKKRIEEEIQSVSCAYE